MKLNQELIKNRCQEILDSLERLEKIKSLDKEEFLKNRDLQKTWGQALSFSTKTFY